MDTPKKGLPLVTVLICIICVGVFWEQFKRDEEYFTALDDFCSNALDRQMIDALRRAIHVESGNPCFEVFEAVRDTSGPMLTLQLLAINALPTGLFANRNQENNHTFNRLQEAYLQFDLVVPRHLTRHLRFDPKNPDVLKMLTATFSHGDWKHLVSNLLFFFIFAGAVELVIGHLVFTAFILLASLGTSLAYQYAMVTVDGAPPTVGLSGVVMAMVACLALMLPYARINCLFWFLVIVRIFHVPAMFLAIWYVGWDIYDMRRFGMTSGINYVAHISGAMMGILLATYYVVFEPKRVQESRQYY